MTAAYTIAASCAPIAVVAVELAVLRTGILRTGRFWATIVITLAFQVAVDGWLTKLSAPVVIYRPAAISGVRWPWDIPVEDFGFSFAMITLTLALWERVLHRGPRAPVPATEPGRPAAEPARPALPGEPRRLAAQLPGPVRRPTPPARGARP
jgi:lycopene cyclase domain-containing protein